MRRRALSLLACLALLALTFPTGVRAAESWSVSKSELVTATLTSSSGTSTSLELVNNVSIKPWGSQTLGEVLDALGFGGGYSQEAIWTGGSGVTISCPNMLLVDIPMTCVPDGHGGGKVTIPNGLRAELNVSAIASGGSATVEVAPNDDSFNYDIAVTAIGLALEVLSPGPIFGVATRVAGLAFRLVRDAASCDAAIKRGDKNTAAYDLWALSLEALTIINDIPAEWGLAGLDAIPAWMGIKLGLAVLQIIEDLSNLHDHLESGNAATTVTIRYGPAPPTKGAFTPTGSMGDTSPGPVTLLPSGDVVAFFTNLVPGANGPIVSSTSTELYNPRTGKFLPAGRLMVPRNGASATALANGTVLVAGGSSDIQGQFPLASAELFDPRTGTSVATGSMTVPRATATATLLSDGRVLVAGGFEEVPSSVGSCCIGESLASAEIYDPRTGAFTPTGSMLEPRDHGTGIILPGGQVLILAGERWVQQGYSSLGTAEIFDPATERFSAAGSLATAREGPAIAQLRDGRILVAGGANWVPGPGNTLSAEPLASAEVYDPKTGASVPTGSLVVGRWQAATTTLGNGTVLIAGGFDHGGNGPALASAELYDPASGTFSSVGSMSIARAGAWAVPLPDGSALVLGGFPASPGQELSSAEVFR